MKRFLILFVVVCLLSGCAIQQNHPSENTGTTVAEEFLKIEKPFIIVYGENGQKLEFHRKDVFDSTELANLMIAMSEPGFVVFASQESIDEGLHIQLERLFRIEGFQRTGMQEHQIGKKIFWQLNFVKNGEVVLVM